MKKQNNARYPRRGALGVFANAGGNPAGNPAEVVESIRAGLQDWQNKYDGDVQSLRDQLSASQGAYTEMEKKMAELQASYDDMAKKYAAGQMGGQNSISPEAAEQSAAMASYLRSGQISAALTKEGELGVVAPTEWDRTVTNKLIEVSPGRRLFSVMPTSKASFKKVYNLHGFASGWVGETDERPETNTGSLVEYVFNSGEIYANPAVSQTALDDAEINVEELINEELSTEFATRENQAFFAGDGLKGKPLGILTFVDGQKNASNHPLGAIEAVPADYSSNGYLRAEDMLDLVGALPSTFSPNAGFMMNRKTQTAARKMKDDQGNFLWQQSMQAGKPNLFLGYPVYEMAEMPDMGSGSIPILFGDFKQAYMILDRKGIRVLRDPFSKKPYISFYTTKRVGGAVLNPEAVKAFVM